MTADAAVAVADWLDSDAVAENRAADEVRNRLAEVADLIGGALTSAWVVYSHDRGPYAIALYPNPAPAAQHAARAGYGHVAEWPFGMEFADAIAKWEGR